MRKHSHGRTPPSTGPSPSARVTSVARSLAAAAAALRASEWRGAHDDVAAETCNTNGIHLQRRTDVDEARRQGHAYNDYEENAMSYRPHQPYTRQPYHEMHNYSYEQEHQMHDRHAFYEDLRARHRHLTQRQRLAREHYANEQQQRGQERDHWVSPRRDHRGRAVLAAAVNQDSTARHDRQSSGRFSDHLLEGMPRQRVVVDGHHSFNRRHQPSFPADAAGRRYKPSVYLPPAAQLVSSLVPRVSASGVLDRRMSDPPANGNDEEVVRSSRNHVVEKESLERSAQTPPGWSDAAPVVAPISKVSGPITRSKIAPPSSQTSTNSLLTAKTTENTAEVVEDPDVDGESEEVAMDDDAPEGQKKPKKRVRYLRDIDRRNIIKRIENGEKQAALAREFGVTRAAICHIKKNKDEILSRYNFLVKSAHDMDIAENFSGPSGVNMMVHEIRYNSVLLLMTMLRDSRSTGATFRRVAGRLIMILLEEALAIVGTLSVEVVTGTGHLYQGLKLKHQFCGVAIGAEGYPFLVLFHQMEPQAPQGSIHVEMAADRQGQQVWRLDHMDLPANITQHKILLFSSACSTGEVECKAIDALCNVGCEESSILLVVILAAVDGVVTISNCYPQVKIVTGAIDSKVDQRTQSIIPGFGDFVSRYNDA